MEWKLFEHDRVPFVSTFAFHADRERAPHWDQPTHRPRLERAAQLVLDARTEVFDGHVSDPDRIVKVVDLGCGDGGLIAHLNQNWSHIVAAVGYDFQPSNVKGHIERGVGAQTFAVDFVESWDFVIDADVYVMTEVLEHLADPHLAVRRVRERQSQLVCSSPWTETYDSHDECHAWAWDPEGYAKLITDADFEIRVHDRVGMFQLIWAVPRA